MLFSGLDSATADECAWYWINIMIDTTFGVLVCWGFLKASERLFGYDSGHYGKEAKTGIDWETNPDFFKWGKQIAAWRAIVCTHWISNVQVRLVFVMIITPACMNMFQFWVSDNFLKFSKKSEASEDEEHRLRRNIDEDGGVRWDTSRTTSTAYDPDSHP